MSLRYDLVVIGGGSAGLMAADFAARLGASVALVEKHRIGGDCTWTGCVPSKALLKAAKVAHETRRAAQYGVLTGPPTVDMLKVREYIRQAIAARPRPWRAAQPRRCSVVSSATALSLPPRL